MAKSAPRPSANMTAAMTQQLAKMREEMMRAQDALAEERLTVSVGGEAVTVVIDGQQRFHHIQISLDALAAAQTDRDMLQDLLVAAMNAAMEQSQALAAERLNNLTGGLGLPPF